MWHTLSPDPRTSTAAEAVCGAGKLPPAMQACQRRTAPTVLRPQHRSSAGASRTRGGKTPKIYMVPHKINNQTRLLPITYDNL